MERARIPLIPLILTVTIHLIVAMGARAIPTKQIRAPAVAVSLRERVLTRGVDQVIRRRASVDVEAVLLPTASAALDVGG